MVGRSEHSHALVKSRGPYNAEELDRLLSRFMELVQQVQDSEALNITDPKDPWGRFSSAWWHVFQPWWDPGKKMPSKHGNFMEFRKPTWWPKMVIKHSLLEVSPQKGAIFFFEGFSHSLNGTIVASPWFNQKDWWLWIMKHLPTWCPQTS